MDMLNLSGYDGFTMYLDSDGSGNEIKVQMETDTSTYAYTGYMTGKGPMLLYMPFSKIIQPDWATSGTPQPINSSQNLKSVSIYTNQVGTITAGTLYVDDLKGANFVEDLTGKAGVTIDEPSNEVTEFPYTITGTADYVEYVTVSIGDNKYNVPVDGEGNWSFELTKDAGIVNSDAIKVKAGVYYPDGEAVAESAEYTIGLKVEDNDGPEEEHYDNMIWNWDFEEMGTEGWSFEGFSPWTENGKLVAWSQDGYNAVFSYTITDVPNGVYTLSNDIKVKSNMNSAVMALFSGDSEVKSAPIDTADTVVEDQLLGEKLTVNNNTVTVKYYVNAPADANGVTFAVGDVKLYLVKALENDESGDDEDPGEVSGGDENGDSEEGSGDETSEDSGEGAGTESEAVKKPETVNDENNVNADAADAGSTAVTEEVIDSKQKKTSISELTARKKAITVSWKKQSKGGIKGYEIQYSTNKKFEENVKTVKIGKVKTTKKTIKKLKSGKKYYVRIRTYKEKDGGMVYSKWSKKKSIKVK
ncbi:MAG: fibronectin type III domain-containing protein [Butyrivibrio sp.]|nr:fibronectin type III domain-containing protein [Butyrivibrio sp.]